MADDKKAEEEAARLLGLGPLGPSNSTADPPMPWELEAIERLKRDGAIPPPPPPSARSGDEPLDIETVLNTPDLSKYGYTTRPHHSMERSERSSEKAVFEPATKITPTSASEQNFTVAVTIYGGMFVTGLFLLGDNAFFSSGWWYGLVYTVGGGAGTVTVTPLFRKKLEVMRSPRSLWAAAVATWLLLAMNLGFAVYDHFWSKAPAPGQQRVSTDIWPALTSTEASALAARVRFIPPENIVVACETIKCRDLADGIAEILQKTPGWKVSILHHGGLGIDGVAGILLNPNEPAAQALKEAIEATTGLAVTVGPDARKDFGSSPTLLVVGIRPF